jgi:hypothetical protein
MVLDFAVDPVTKRPYILEINVCLPLFSHVTHNTHTFFHSRSTTTMDVVLQQLCLIGKLTGVFPLTNQLKWRILMEISQKTVGRRVAV